LYLCSHSILLSKMLSHLDHGLNPWHIYSTISKPMSPYNEPLVPILKGLFSVSSATFKVSACLDPTLPEKAHCIFIVPFSQVGWVVDLEIQIMANMNQIFIPFNFPKSGQIVNTNLGSLALVDSQHYFIYCIHASVFTKCILPFVEYIRLDCAQQQQLALFVQISFLISMQEDTPLTVQNIARLRSLFADFQKLSPVNSKYNLKD